MLKVCQQDLERMAQLKDTAVADRLELQTRASEQQDRLRALDQTVAYLTGQVSSKYAQFSKMYIACICRTDPGVEILSSLSDVLARTLARHRYIVTLVAVTFLTFQDSFIRVLSGRKGGREGGKNGD